MIRIDVKANIQASQRLLFQQSRTQSQQDKSWKSVLHIARAYCRGAPLPPLAVTAGPDGWVIVDGHHRLCGAALAGVVSLPAVEA